MTDVSTEAPTEEENVSPPWGTLPTEAYLLVNFYAVLSVGQGGAPCQSG